MRKAEKLFFPSAIVPEIEKQKKHSFRTFSIFIGDSRIVLKKQWTTSACDNLGIFNHSIDERRSFSASRHNEMRFCSRTNFYFLSLKVFLWMFTLPFWKNRNRIDWVKWICDEKEWRRILELNKVLYRHFRKWASSWSRKRNDLMRQLLVFCLFRRRSLLFNLRSSKVFQT